jgi:valacyclovir hydrolase
MPYVECAGHRLFYREVGHGPTLLILPGNTASSAHHLGEVEHFGRRFHAVSLDFWGTGQSDRLAEWPTDWYVQAAHDVAALIAHLGPESASVVGTSGGAIVALLLAILHPSRVRAVIADSCTDLLYLDMMRDQAVQRARQTPEQIAFWQWAQGDDWVQVVEADTHMLLRLAEHGGDWSLGRLGEIACPVLLTGSLGDDLIPDPGTGIVHLTQQIASSYAVIFPQGNHPLMWSRPLDFRRVADQFLDTLLE